MQAYGNIYTIIYCVSIQVSYVTNIIYEFHPYSILNSVASKSSFKLASNL